MGSVQALKEKLVRLGIPSTMVLHANNKPLSDYEWLSDLVTSGQVLEIAVIVASEAPVQSQEHTLQLYAADGDLGNVRRLLASGANVNAVIPGDCDNTPLHNAARMGRL